jgi:hypothetical protein
VAVAGYSTCGNQCDEIIIDREPRFGDKDILMNCCKIGLLICLVVGVIIRNQSNKAGIFGILDQFKKINRESEGVIADRRVSYEQLSANVSQDEIGTADGTNQPKALVDQMDKASSVVLKEEIDQKSNVTIFIVQFFNSLVPALTAILVKENLINYVEAGSGFLAPVFIIIYPCKILLLQALSPSDFIKKEWLLSALPHTS